MVTELLRETRVMPTPNQCDFCSRYEPARRLTLNTCRDFTRLAVLRAGTLVLTTCTCHTPFTTRPGDEVTEHCCIGAWAACPECQAAINHNDRAALARIAAAETLQREPELHSRVDRLTRLDLDGLTQEPPTWAELYRATFEGFWLHRERGRS